MIRKPRTEAGLKDLHRSFGVVTKPGQTGPNMRDVDTGRGPLCYVPRNPINKVMTFSDEPGRSPARGHYAPGRVYTGGTDQTGKGFPESQRTGSRVVTP